MSGMEGYPCSHVLGMEGDRTGYGEEPDQQHPDQKEVTRDEDSPSIEPEHNTVRDNPGLETC